MPDIALMGAVYPDVPSVILPTDPTGTAQFYHDLNPIIVRPDAEKVKTWSTDYYVHADKGITIPSYSTTSQTLVAESQFSDTYTLDNDRYRYYITYRALTIPEYSVTTKAKGREEYHAYIWAYEGACIPSDTIEAILDNKKYTGYNMSFQAASFSRMVYWNNSTSILLYTGTGYGVAQVLSTAPALSAANVSNPVLTVTCPAVNIRGSATYLSSTYYNAITDIRVQCKIDLYRTPVGTLNIDGWERYQLMLNVLNAAKSTSHTLT